MKTCRIHITGASGAGISTLGQTLSHMLGSPHHDADDYFWLPTSPPYIEKRPVADRLRLMEELFLDRPDWVLSGSLDSWGKPIVSFFDLVVFIKAPVDVRLARLREREERRYGIDAVSPGGSRYQATEEFIEWASHYDDGSAGGRNLARHESWLETLTCDVIRADGTEASNGLAEEVLQQLKG